MRYLVLLIAVLMLRTPPVRAENYYVSEAGDDARDGRSPATAWRTLEKVNSMMDALMPGDTVFFERGGVYRGTLDVTASGAEGQPLCFAAYGTGDMPVVLGSRPVTGWSLLDGKIWQADGRAFEKGVRMLFVDSLYHPPGRYPNKGYRTICSTWGEKQIVDKGLDAPPDHWKGGEIVIKVRRWYINRLGITSSNGDTINFYENRPFEIQPGFGYFIQQHINTLDLNDEWAYDGNAGKIRLLKDDGRDPNLQSVEGDYYDYGISLYMVEHVRVQDLHFARHRLAGVRILLCADIGVTRCRVTYPAGKAVTIEKSSFVSVSENEFENCGSGGIAGTDVFDTEITDNTLKKVAVVPGNFTGQAVAVGITSREYVSENDLIQYNTIDSTGYIGVNFKGKNLRILNNFIDHAMLIMNDGGGIYTYDNDHTGNEVTGNIILHATGTDEGAPRRYPCRSVGIYLDDHSGSITVTGNTVAHCGSGIFVHNTGSSVIRDNLCYDNAVTQLKISQSYAEEVRDLVVQDNVFFAAEAGQRVYALASLQGDIASFGDFNHNYLYNPYDSAMVSEQFTPEGAASYTILYYTPGKWTRETGLDADSKTTPVAWGYGYHVEDTLGDNLIDNPGMDEGLTGWEGVGSVPPVLSHETDTSLLGSPCMRSWFPAGAGQVNIYASRSVAVKAGDIFEVSFKIVAGKEGAVIVRIANSGGSENNYKTLTQERLVPFNAWRKEPHFLLTAFEDAIPEGARLIFEFHTAGTNVWMDEVNLHKVTGAAPDKNEQLAFYCNPSTGSRRVDLPRPMRTIDGDLVSAITLEGYDSEVLLADDFSTIIRKPLRKHAERKLLLYPVPADDRLYVEVEGQEIREIVVYRITGRQILHVRFPGNMLEVGQWTEGTYILRARTDRDVFEKVFLVVHPGE